MASTEEVKVEIEDKKTPTNEESTKTNKWCTKRVLINTAMLIVWIAVFEGVSFGLGRAFPTDEWYESQIKSPGTPPGISFAVIWTILYITLATFGWFLSLKLCERQILYLFIVFWVQQILNWCWVPVFQKLHQAVAGLVILCVLIVLNVGLVVRMWQLKIEILGVKTRYIGLILIPYLIWACYATHMNAYIVAMNDWWIQPQPE